MLKTTVELLVRPKNGSCDKYRIEIDQSVTTWAELQAAALKEPVSVSIYRRVILLASRPDIHLYRGRSSSSIYT